MRFPHQRSLSTGVLGALALIYYFSARELPPPAAPAKSSALAEKAPNLNSQRDKPASPPGAEKASGQAENPPPAPVSKNPAPPLDPETAAEARALIASFDLFARSETFTAPRKMRALVPDREQLAAFLLRELQENPSGDKRDRLVWLANSLQGPELLDFWNDLLTRKTERFPGEIKLRNPQHPSLESRLIDVEQLQALRNIGLIAGTKPAARAILLSVVSAEAQSELFRAMHREQAFIALKEIDPAAVLRVLSNLPEDDELRQRLQVSDRAQQEPPKP